MFGRLHENGSTEQEKAGSFKVSPFVTQKEDKR